MRERVADCTTTTTMPDAVQHRTTCAGGYVEHAKGSSEARRGGQGVRVSSPRRVASAPQFRETHQIEVFVSECFAWKGLRPW